MSDKEHLVAAKSAVVDNRTSSSALGTRLDAALHALEDQAQLHVEFGRRFENYGLNEALAPRCLLLYDEIRLLLF